MRYLVTMTIDIEEVMEKASMKKPTPTRIPEEPKPPTMPMNDQLVFGIQEAANLLGISRSSIYILIREGKLPVVKLGRRTLIPVQELKSLLQRMQAPR